MRTRLKQLALANEATYGAPEVLGAGDVQFEVEDLNATYVREQINREPLRRTLSQKPTVPGRSRGEITGRAELLSVGSTPATSPPLIDLLISAGLQELEAKTIVLDGAPTGTFIPGELVTGGSGGDIRVAHIGTGIGVDLALNTMLYVIPDGSTAPTAGDNLTGSKSGATAQIHLTTPADTAVGFGYMPTDPDTSDSITAAVYEDGNRFEVHGARSNISFSAVAGNLGFAEFTTQGAAIAPLAAGAPLLTGLTLPDVDPETFVEARLTVDTDLLCVENFAMDLGNNLAEDICANLVITLGAAIRGYRITDRTPTITIDPEGEPENVINFWNKYDQATQFGFFARIGITAGHRIAFCAPSCQYQEISKGDREGILTHESTLRLNGSEDDGDDELLIVFF